MVTPRPIAAQLAGLILMALLLVVVSTGSHAAMAPHAFERSAGHAADSPPAVSISRALREAERAAAGAPGRVAYALALPGGHVFGRDLDATFPSASISKSLLAVALLRSPTWSRDGAALADASLMVRYSDNAAADRTLARVGSAAVHAVAREAGMGSFRMTGSWAGATVTARDFARLFMSAPELVPPAQRAQLRGWLGGIIPAQRWGIPAALEPSGARVLFKGGWRSGVVHQAARVERGGAAVGMAILTDGGPRDTGAEIQTIERVARALGGVQERR